MTLATALHNPSRLFIAGETSCARCSSLKGRPTLIPSTCKPRHISIDIRLGSSIHARPQLFASFVAYKFEKRKKMKKFQPTGNGQKEEMCRCRIFRLFHKTNSSNGHNYRHRIPFEFVFSFFSNILEKNSGGAFYPEILNGKIFLFLMLCYIFPYDTSLSSFSYSIISLR